MIKKAHKNSQITAILQKNDKRIDENNHPVFKKIKGKKQDQYIISGGG